MVLSCDKSSEQLDYLVFMSKNVHKVTCASLVILAANLFANGAFAGSVVASGSLGIFGIINNPAISFMQSKYVPDAGYIIERVDPINFTTVLSNGLAGPHGTLGIGYTFDNGFGLGVEWSLVGFEVSNNDSTVELSRNTEIMKNTGIMGVVSYDSLMASHCDSRLGFEISLGVGGAASYMQNGHLSASGDYVYDDSEGGEGRAVAAAKLAEANDALYDELQKVYSGAMRDVWNNSRDTTIAALGDANRIDNIETALEDHADKGLNAFKALAVNAINGVREDPNNVDKQDVIDLLNGVKSDIDGIPSMSSMITKREAQIAAQGAVTTGFEKPADVVTVYDLNEEMKEIKTKPEDRVSGIHNLINRNKRSAVPSSRQHDINAAVATNLQQINDAGGLVEKSAAATKVERALEDLDRLAPNLPDLIDRNDAAESLRAINYETLKQRIVDDVMADLGREMVALKAAAAQTAVSPEALENAVKSAREKTEKLLEDVGERAHILARAKSGHALRGTYNARGNFSSKEHYLFTGKARCGVNYAITPAVHVGMGLSAAYIAAPKDNRVKSKITATYSDHSKSVPFHFVDDSLDVRGDSPIITTAFDIKFSYRFGW
jgi:hypothetical protein